MLPILGGILSGLLGSSASRRASNAQTAAAQQSLDFNKQVYSDISNNFAPYLQSGLQGQQAYNSLLGLGAAPAGFQGYQQSPGYQFQLNQGLDAAQSSAAARGGLMSGKTLADLNTYGQGVANQDYQTYLNRLQGIGTQGQAAAGIVGSANAWTGGLNNALSGWGYMQANPNAFGAR